MRPVLVFLRGGHWGLSETGKSAKRFIKTEKGEYKSLKTDRRRE